MRAYGLGLLACSLSIALCGVAGCSSAHKVAGGAAGASGASGVGVGGSAGTSGGSGALPGATGTPGSRGTGGTSGTNAGGAGGSSGSAGSIGSAGSGGSAAVSCPPYQSFCGGACVGTSQDPNNCGACGQVCGSGQACSAGVCSSTCTTPPNGGNPQIIKCGQLCVDRFNDNHSCGACGTDCMSQVCAGGQCVPPSFTLNPGAMACPNGGPPINITDGKTTACAGLIAQTTFRWGMCACGNVSLVNSGQAWGPAHPGLDFPALYIDAYDSSKGPWDPNSPELGGSLGVNGTFASKSGAFTFLTGNMWSASSINAAGPTDVKQELHAVGPITTSAAFNVGQPNSSTPPPTVTVVPGTVAADGYVSGNITASGAPMTFYKDLYVPSAGTTRTNVVVNGSLKTSDMTFPPPCDSCGKIPVGTIVDQYAAAANNDNAAIGLSPSAMANLNGTTRLDLPCGYYYLDGINAQGSATIYAHGHTALFIGGDVSADSLSFTVEPTGSFDIFIKGTLQTQSDLVVGNPNYAALTRTYVGATGFSLNGEAHISGLFYVASSDVQLQSHLTVYGALYCNNFDGVGDNTDIHYDRAALKLDRECCANNDPNFEGSCPGSPPPQCTSCKDCGNQACINGACAHCTSSAQCCAPLTCQAGLCVDSVQ